MDTCPKCWARLDTPLFCEQCDELRSPTGVPSPYQVLGVDVAYGLDKMALRKRLLALSRKVHPDFYGGSRPEERALAERNAAELNAAFEILADDFRRADWLVESLDGPSEEQERQMPQEFLLEVLEWNEAVEAARDAAPDSPERAALGELERTLRGERERLMARIAELLTPLPDVGDAVLTEARRELNAVRYVDRTLREIGELRLRRAPARP